MPSTVRSVLSKIGLLAGEFGSPAYIVGGAVRDRILGRPLLDIDLVVEGDAIAVARAAAEVLPAELRTHEDFLTAVLLLEGGWRIDLASTRMEQYASEAALPSVRPASLIEDLCRRDFTVNSMAVPIDQPETSDPIDPSGGRDDLAARRLRVHHERSFLDDPTRILRGVRFETRLALNFEPDTERLAREACAAGAVERLSADRLRTELELLFAEELDPQPAWARLGELGVLDAAGLPSESAGAVLGRVGRTLEDWRERPGGERSVERSRVLLEALLLAEEPERRQALADRLGTPVGNIGRFEELTTALGRAGLLPHEAAALLGDLSMEELLLVEALGDGEARALVENHLLSQRDFELRIDGATLLARGFDAGPAIGGALRATREARLDGLITGGEELAFAVGLLRGENRER